MKGSNTKPQGKALSNYTLVIGHLTSFWHEQGHSYAYLHLVAGTHHVVAKINLRSNIPPHTLMFCSDSVSTEFSAVLSPQTNDIHRIDSDNQELALDYLRDYLMDRHDSIRIPYSADVESNPVFQALNSFGDQETTQTTYRKRFYLWGRLDTANRNGTAASPFLLHDIHMNQGSRGLHEAGNRVGHDGAVVVEEKPGRFKAIYLAFSSQVWDTDDRVGNPVGYPLPDHVVETDAVVRIVAARLSVHKDDEVDGEITLINRSDKEIELDQWQLLNHEGVGEPLRGHAIAPGECIKISLGHDNGLLRTQGGVLRLVAENDLLVHEVTYKETNPLATAWTLLFQ